jgi:hypothetical protein
MTAATKKAYKKMDKKLGREMAVMNRCREAVAANGEVHDGQQQHDWALALYAGIRSTATRYLRTAEHEDHPDIGPANPGSSGPPI